MSTKNYVQLFIFMSPPKLEQSRYNSETCLRNVNIQTISRLAGTKLAFKLRCPVLPHQPINAGCEILHKQGNRELLESAHNLGTKLFVLVLAPAWYQKIAGLQRFCVFEISIDNDLRIASGHRPRADSEQFQEFFPCLKIKKIQPRFTDLFLKPI
ncbi:hypothetical protein AYO21_11985 [Fonsecaea monophora]|uniref:Uncharacterized protein n=1 Tax=Fonsecaea monophora TaxID=254056 RepID=A0A177ESD6_9EURO|nr:hypothetical protein AYO21_11985 [Fonsecaea monophora]OAG33899.1 hypothetical protein AYO21_11985 [Fonsecaea monophora]